MPEPQAAGGEVHRLLNDDKNVGNKRVLQAGSAPAGGGHHGAQLVLAAHALSIELYGNGSQSIDLLGILDITKISLQLLEYLLASQQIIRIQRLLASPLFASDHFNS
ncbi:hypothetical protein [Neorhizobium sp. JUb45]|uniref:hypothetical protein n=1 Tax=Neorhizobium sp. JUb45 TaxID=2485113 RepID=UPI0014047C92